MNEETKSLHLNNNWTFVRKLVDSRLSVVNGFSNIKMVIQKLVN